VGDAYQIKIPGSVRRRMQEWDLTSAVRAAMEARLRNELAPNPVEQLVRVVGAFGDILNLFEFLIKDESDRDATHIFQFHFVYGQDEKHLEMLECSHQRFDSDPDDDKTPVM
jgi:hypothetical protein